MSYDHITKVYTQNNVCELDKINVTTNAVDATGSQTLSMATAKREIYNLKCQAPNQKITKNYNIIIELPIPENIA